MLVSWKNRYDKPGKHIKKQRHLFANIGPSSQSYGFPIGHVVMGQTIKKAEHQRIDAFNCGDREDSCGSLDSKEIKPVSPKGNQS